MLELTVLVLPNEVKRQDGLVADAPCTNTEMDMEGEDVSVDANGPADDITPAFKI